MHTTTQRELSVLLLAADSGEGGLGEMLDPRLREEFAAAGIQCRACYVGDLQRAHLDLFHCVVLLRSPVPQHPFGDAADFREKSVWLQEFVACGGGLFLMFTECYGKTESTLNELCAPWQIRFYFNRLVPDAHVATDRFPRLHESTLLPVTVVANPFLPLPFDTLKVVTEGGHGTQHLTCVPEPGSAWHPVMRGGAHISSQSYGTFYINTSRETIHDPILCAVREAGAGRVVAFPGSAPFWLTNAHIWRFQGRLQNQDGGRGFRFFCEALRWLADTRRGRQLPSDCVAQAARVVDAAWLNKPSQYSFRPVSAEDQGRMRRSVAQKLWIGLQTPEREVLGDMATALAREGYRLAFPLAPYEILTDAGWDEAKQRCQAAGAGLLELRPGYELRDDEGMVSAVVSPTTLPKHTLRYPNSTLLENVWICIFGCLSILRHPLANRIPPQRYGGYNLIEWDPSAEWFARYQALVASKYFISPIAFNTRTGGDACNTWVVVPEGRQAFDMLRTNNHATFISDGPVLERFCWSGPGLISDEWEGFWYGYYPGDAAVLNVRLRAECPLAEVVLYDGEDVLARFEPGQAEFEKRLQVRVWRDLCLHLTARDSAGRRLFATYPLYTRNFGFWGHVGSDQMNNYVNAMTPAPNGFLGVGHRLFDMFGFVTLGAAWGDYLRITPALSYAEFMPRQEISGVIGSFNVHHPSAIVTGGDGEPRYLNDHRRVFPYCGADAQVFRSDVVGEQRDNDTGRRERWHGREVVPTRLLTPVPGARGHDEYVVWRWEVNQPICVEVRKHVQFAPGWLKDSWLTFASNSHWSVPGLYIRSMRDVSHGLRIADLPVFGEPVPAGKEWDNSFFLRLAHRIPPAVFAPGHGGELEIGTGAAGTFGLVPLGAPREIRTQLWVTAKEVQVLFQCRLTEAERQSGCLDVSYLVLLDATESAGTPFGSVLDAISRASAGAGGARRFSVTVDVAGRAAPFELDLDTMFPDCAGFPLHVELRGQSDALMEWCGPGGVPALVSQPQHGRSWHRLPAAPHRYTAMAGRAWEDLGA
ncbi:MAG: hypothetical protein K8T26_06425 [Lentisphaerae bacterium]|nr:hypothetical protein [Lentisphaerota bacterium]